MFSVVRSLCSALYIAFLFNQYDIISTIAPVIVVGVVLAGIPDLKAFFHGIVWQELHLIAFEIIGLEEDKLSKPSRPLVSGRLTVQKAHKIYLLLIVLSPWNSASHGILACSILHLVSMFAYNELRLSRHSREIEG
ncbi:hypothetical protein B0H14DRAFT_2414475 [Mycena olivaceomarginata]|nr:hypothetical protein B0H14DRAFT_2414475 [Mycena olivaceomarginata]